jgi:hypothetical protein
VVVAAVPAGGGQAGLSGILGKKRNSFSPYLLDLIPFSRIVTGGRRKYMVCVSVSEGGNMWWYIEFVRNLEPGGKIWPYCHKYWN